MQLNKVERDKDDETENQKASENICLFLLFSFTLEKPQIQSMQQHRQRGVKQNPKNKKSNR
jgi:hypothetical protein